MYALHQKQDQNRARKAQSYGSVPFAVEIRIGCLSAPNHGPPVNAYSCSHAALQHKAHRDSDNVTSKRPKTLWDAIKQALETAPIPLSEQALVQLVAASDYPGSPTRVRIRSVLRRQILFDHVAETEPGEYQLTNR